MMRRYWETEEEDEFKVQEACLTCGEEGHEKRNCPHQLCLACGAFDDHTTRQCRQGINCHRCGGRGHTTGDCKQPRQVGSRGYARECVLCGSGSHMDASCPTLFRVYYYNAEPEYRTKRKELWDLHAPRDGKTVRRPVVLDYQSSSSSSSNSEDDEGEEAEKESGTSRAEKRASNNTASNDSPPSEWDPANVWCYNCASHEHWGDDCRVPRCNPTRMTGEPSVYSDVLGNSGPFARELVQAVRRNLGQRKHDREQDYGADLGGHKRFHSSSEDAGRFGLSSHFDPLPASHHSDKARKLAKPGKTRGRKDPKSEHPQAKPYYGGALARKNRWKKEAGDMNQPWSKEGGESTKKSVTKRSKKKKKSRSA